MAPGSATYDVAYSVTGHPESLGQDARRRPSVMEAADLADAGVGELGSAMRFAMRC
jgi:hypothetical protein